MHNICETGYVTLQTENLGNRVKLSVGQVLVSQGDLLDGYPVSINNPNAADVLAFDGTKFTNKPQVELVDGGNF